jgi:hypothetical protein
MRRGVGLFKKDEGASMRTLGTGTLVAVVLAIGLALGAAAIAQTSPPTVTLTGCVERDATSKTPLYHLVVTESGKAVVYQLNAPPKTDTPNLVGKIVAATGTVAMEKRGGRDIQVLTAREVKVVNTECK